MEHLPGEVISLICEELSNQQNFNGLFNYAAAGKTFAEPALRWLYRIHHLSPIMSSEGSDADSTGKFFMKWALLWKSIIRSSLGNTAYPYCLYIKFLDFRSLGYLLDDPKFEDSRKAFFANDMARFLKSHGTPMKQKVRSAKRYRVRLDVPLILELVGESMTTFIKDSADKNAKAVALEDIAGDISATALPRWTTGLSRLKSMTLWDGSALDITAATAISESCPDFDDLSFFACPPWLDSRLATFFTSLRPNTLRSFAVLSSGVGPETLLALNHHSRSLKFLRLGGLKSEAITKLSSIQGCNMLESLEITDLEVLVDLEETENDVYLEVIAWLGSCERLRTLVLKYLVSGPSILTQVCLKNNIRLQKLSILGYPLVGNQDFHKALSHQTSLEFLELKADPEDAFRDDIDTLVSSISNLKKLKYLNILSTSDYFRTSEILTLTSHLTDLEDLSFGGYDVTDDLWHGLANLYHLRSLNIHAVTSFSFDGILAYISTLHDTNYCFHLSIMCQIYNSPISEGQREIIRQSLSEKVDGKLDFTWFRDPESESETLSD